MILYWFKIDVGDYSFCAMAEHPVIEDISIDVGQLRVTESRCHIIDSYVLRSPTESDRRMIQRDYERRLDQLGEKQLPLGLGNPCMLVGLT